MGSWKLLAAAACIGLFAAAITWQQSDNNGTGAATDYADTQSALLDSDSAPLAQSPRRSSAPPPASRAHAQAAQSLAELVAMPSHFEQSAALYALALKGDQSQLLALIDEANNLADVQDRRAATGILLLRFLELDPEAALSQARALDGLSNQRHTVNLYIAWARIDSEAVLRSLAAGTQEERRKVRSTFAAIAKDTGKAVYSEIASHLLRTLKAEQNKRNAIAQQASEDPLGAWANAANITQPGKRRQAQQTIMRVWGQSDPAAAMQFISTLPRAQRAMLQQMIIGNWAEKAPEAALAWIQQSPEGLARSRMLEIVISHFSNIDMDRALALADQLPPAQRAKGIDRALRKLSRGDPDAALERLRASGIDLEDSQTFIRIITNRKRYSPQQSLELARNAGPKALQRAALPLINRLAGTDPEAAVAALDYLADPKLHAQASGQIVHQWALNDPDATADWIGTRPPAQRDALSARMVQTLGQVDLELAKQHLQNIGDNAQHDQAIIQLLPRLQYDPEGAEDLLSSIRTDEGKARARKNLNYLNEARFGTTFSPSPNFTTSQ